MKVEQTGILSLLGRKGTSFSVPVYQRPYTWGKGQLEALWKDVMRAAKSGLHHFTGTVFFAPSSSGELSIIDGQQRMVTLYLMVNALAKTLEANPCIDCDRSECDRRTGVVSPISENLNAGTIRRTYLSSAGACKVSASRPDRKSVEHVVLETALPPEDEQSEAVLKNHNWFLSKMKTPGFCADDLWRGLELLRVISVVAEDGDRAQSIFETLNAKGMPLSECEERFARIHHERDRTIQAIGMNNRVFGD